MLCGADSNQTIPNRPRNYYETVKIRQQQKNRMTNTNDFFLFNYKI